MDTDRLRRGLTISFRSVVLREWRLFAGIVLALAGYGIWVGLSSAAITQLASFADVSTAVDPWTGETTALAGLVFLLWVVLPAIAAVWLVIREVTNVHTNIEKYYRISPTLLLIPPVVLLAVSGGVLAATGTESRPALAVVVIAALFFQVRTLIYSYRVFSFSVPRLTQAGLLVTVAVALLAMLAEAAIALDREPFVEDAADGISELLGVGAVADIPGTTEVFGSSVPTLAGAAIALPVAVSVGYVCLQALVGVVVRLRGKEVPRSKLRTGQRYPDFARPTTDQRSSSPTSTQRTHSGSSSGTAQTSDSDTSRGTNGATTAPSSTDGAAAPGDGSSTDNSAHSTEPQDEKPTATQSAAEGSDDATADDEEVTHTRVFTPDATADQTEIVGDGDSSNECPYCEAGLDPGADTCDNCGASI